MDTNNSLHPLFYPRAIAVVGASREVDSIGFKLFRSLRDSGFRGPLFPINPKASHIGGCQAYPSLSAVPGPVDLVVIAVPAVHVLKVVEDCHQAGVKALVVISAGFGEVGGVARDLEKELLTKVRESGMRMVGPNCFGVLNTDPAAPMNACFSAVFALPGGIAMASQSGAMGLAILNMARQHQIGLSMFVSMGNKADVSSNDLIEYWEKDEKTKAILLYIESFGNPTKFSQIARRVGRLKPIIALKSGRSISGSRAAGSHTAALAANDTAVDALFRQAGVLRVESVDEMFQLAMAVDTQPLPQGGRVAIVTNAGGPAILCADACEAAGLSIPELSEETQARLRTFISSSASSKNPIDLVASAGPELMARAIEEVMLAPEIDSLVVIFAVIDGIPAGLNEAVARGVAKGRSKQCLKPVYFCLMEGEKVHPPVDSIPVFRFPEEPARVLGKLVPYKKWLSTELVPEENFADVQTGTIQNILQTGRGSRWLVPEEVTSVLEEAGIHLLKTSLASTVERALELAAAGGYPVVLKLHSRAISHKTDVGGVQLGLTDASAVKQAFQRIRENLNHHAPGVPFEGVTVQRMAPKGIEIFVGMVRDPVFGPLVGFGLGGVLVEVLEDIRFRLAPITRLQAEQMLTEIRGKKLLDGFRGMPGADKDALVELLGRVSQLSLAVPQIASLDLNPVLGLPPGQGYVVLDARIQIHSE